MEGIQEVVQAVLKQLNEEGYTEKGIKNTSVRIRFLRPTPNKVDRQNIMKSLVRHSLESVTERHSMRDEATTAIM